MPLNVLFGTLILLIILSACFSGAETALMAVNRFRLRHLAKQQHRGALRAQRLLERPDRLIGLILLGNNFANILASSLSTLIALELLGEAGIAVAAGLLTLVILIFGEVIPKTVAFLYPERIAFPAALILDLLLKLLYPVVWVINVITNSLLKLFRIPIDEAANQYLSAEELRTVVNEAGAMIPRRHQQMLLGILDLERVTVEDIMVPRNEIGGIDLDEDWQDIVRQLTDSQYTWLPVYKTSVDEVIGMLHLRDVLHLVARGEFTREDLIKAVRAPYFIPEGTPLNTQLLNFQRRKHRIGFVVNEYGDIQGLVTLEEILEEIVGEFTTDPSNISPHIQPQADGSYLVDSSANIRELNRVLKWQLPTTGPKTLNGLILEYLESIPQPGTSLLLANHPVEIMQTKDNAVKRVRIGPKLQKQHHRVTKQKSPDWPE
jgi:Putative Mg2+ and Co2+ transporter CorB